MADGACSGDPVGNVIEKTIVKDYDNDVVCEKTDRVNDVDCAKVKSFYVVSDSDKLFNKLSAGDTGKPNNKHEGFLTCEDDCRKKRCVDRYDSSESSDSGVAVLSCTDCSGSSTASSDITDPGSPFSTASSHSEDSGTASQPSNKMPPTQTAHPPWPWTTATTEDNSNISLKRSLQDKTAFSKRIKSSEEPANKTKQTPPCLNNTKKTLQLPIKDSTQNPSLISEKLMKSKVVKKIEVTATPKMQQGKITEYFKSQIKCSSIKKELSSTLKGDLKPTNISKFNQLVDQKNGLNNKQIFRKNDVVKASPAMKKLSSESKARKLSPVTVPRKILPAPSKVPEKLTINNHINNIANFPPTVTLTAVGFPPNLTYIHTKTPKPPDNIFVQQFTAITNDKISTIPIINRTPCLNVIQPVQKIATINNFNCVKLNATVVPIVKLNTLPSRLNGSHNNLANVALSVETAVPTVLSAKPKINESSITTATIPSVNHSTPKQQATTPVTPIPSVADIVQNKCRTEEECRSEDQRTQDKCRTKPDAQNYNCTTRLEESNSAKSPTNDSDSGISNKDSLEVCVSDVGVALEPQKSPILSQPKTIRFPVRQDIKEDIKDTKSPHTSDFGVCRWTDCNAQFDTSGALLDHLQVKHVISQTTQEKYVCLWLGCKVHGRKSCSRSWLERHILAHTGNKPFRCIVGRCGQRFNSQLMLERHVNGHFNADGTQNNTAKKSTDNSCVKLLKRNGKRIRFRRQPWSARMFDFIDPGIMEGLQYNLLTMTQKRTLGQLDNAGDTVNLHSQIIARRIESDGSTKLLVKWQPDDIVPHEWVDEKDFKSTKTVSIPSLNASAKNSLKPSLFPPPPVETVRHKQRRKPISKQQT